MKNFTKVLILALLITTTLTISASASTKVPYTNVLKQGIYKVSETGAGAIKPGKVTIELVSKDFPVYVYVMDSDTIERFSKRFIPGSPVTTGTLLEGDSLIIFGKGEIYISTTPM